jgi:hypothetical protein
MDVKPPNCDSGARGPFRERIVLFGRFDPPKGLKTGVEISLGSEKQGNRDTFSNGFSQCKT